MRVFHKQSTAQPGLFKWCFIAVPERVTSQCAMAAAPAGGFACSALCAHMRFDTRCTRLQERVRRGPARPGQHGDLLGRGGAALQRARLHAGDALQGHQLQPRAGTQLPVLA